MSDFPIRRRIGARLESSRGTGWPFDDAKNSLPDPESWFFTMHRSLMARAARSAGYAVHVATRVGECADKIRSEGFSLHPIQWRRGNMNLFRLIAAVVETRRLYRRVQPDLAHHVAFLPIVIGSIAALGLPVSVLNAFAGLGFTFASKTATARLLSLLAVGLLGWLLKRPNGAVLLQNPDDRAVIAKLGVPMDRIAIIAGSGVDAFTPLAKPTDSIATVALVSRLLDGKGVPTLVRAHEILTERGQAIRLLLAGAPDALNPTSIPERLLDEWRKIPNLVMLGHVDDIRSVWSQAHIAVLPSLGGEGIPMSLLEAAACGRPLVATDVPGCREIARHGVNALLVTLDDPAALADAIETLMQNRGLRLRFGQADRQLVVNEFSSARTGSEIVTLCGRLLAGSSAAKLQPAGAS